jgi:hypothetical protein
MINEPEAGAPAKTNSQGGRILDVEYVLLPEDFIAFTKYTWGRGSKIHRKARRRRWLVVFLCAVMTALYIGGWVWVEHDRRNHIDKARVSHPGWLLIGLAGLTAPGVLVAALYHALLWRHVALARLRTSLQHGESRKFLGWHQISLSPDSFTITDADGSYVLRWKVIEGIDVTEEYAFFFVLENQAFILPKRPFVSGAAFLAFVDAARQFHQYAQIPSLAKPAAQAIRASDSNH